MSLRKALFMLILFFIGLAVYGSEKTPIPERSSEQKSESELQIRLLPNFNAEAVRKISIVSPKGHYALVHPSEEDQIDTGRWVLYQPPNAPVDPEKLKRLLFALENLESKNIINADEREEKEEFGLEPPPLVLILQGENLPPAISIGKEHTLSKRRYAQVEGDSRVFLIDGSFFELLNSSAEEMRDHHPLRQDLTHLSQVLLLRPGADIVNFEKQNAGKWTARLKNETFEVETNLLIGRLRRFLNVKVDQFLDDQGAISALLGLKAPVLTMTLTFSGADGLASRTIIEVGEGVGPDGIGNYFRIQGSPIVYRTDVAFHLSFLRSIDGFRDRMPYRKLDFDNASRVRARLTGGRIFEYHSKQTDFHGVASTSIRNFMKSLELISFEGAVPQVIKDAGLLAPEVEFEVELGTGGKVRFLLGKEIEISESQAKEGPLPDTPAQAPEMAKPRWVGIQSEDNVLRPAIIGADAARSLAELIGEIGKTKADVKQKE